MRAGSRALSIFTSALNARVLRVHSDGPLRPAELEETLGWAPQSSLRAAVGKLCDLGALSRSGHTEKASGVGTELTAAGRELLPVADALEYWLQGAPGGQVRLDDAAAHGIVRTLTAAWDSSMVRTLATQSHTLIELSAGIPDLNYPALKRRLAKLRSTHLVTPVQTGSTSAYVASEWLRRAVVPLTLAGRWEREHDADAEPISRTEMEALLLLSLPLVRLPGRTSGACTLVVLTSQQRTASKREMASVAVEIDRGAIASLNAGASVTQATWALGTTDAWLGAVVEGNHDALRVSGAKPRLAQSIVKALNLELLRS